MNKSFKNIFQTNINEQRPIVCTIGTSTLQVQGVLGAIYYSKI